MLNLYKIICVLFCVEIFASASNGEDLADSFVTKVKGISHQIRDAASDQERYDLATSLLGALNSVDPTKLPAANKAVYERAAYGLFLNFLDLTTDNTTLKEFQEMSRPTMIMDGLVCIKMPDGRYVILEKLNDDNLKAWKNYAEAEYSPYSHIRSFVALQHTLKEVQEKFGWMKYRRDDAGIASFKQRLDRGIEERYDKWVAYIYRGDLDYLNSRGGKRNAELLDMVVSVQASYDCNTYSPMGISRTVHAAERMCENDQKGTPEPKLNPPLSIWFHIAICRIIKSLYPNVEKFWSTPTEEMAHLLINAIGKERVKVGKEYMPKDCPWTDEPDFGEILPSVVTGVDTLLLSLL